MSDDRSGLIKPWYTPKKIGAMSTSADGWYTPKKMLLCDVTAMLKSWHIVLLINDDIESEAFQWCREQFGVWLTEDFYLTSAGVAIAEGFGIGGTIALEALWSDCGAGFIFKNESDAILFKLRWG